jgi:hypothetical protein
MSKSEIKLIILTKLEETCGILTKYDQTVQVRILGFKSLG